MQYETFLLDVKRDTNSPTRLDVLQGKNPRTGLGQWLGNHTKEGWSLVSTQLVGQLGENKEPEHKDGELLVILSKP